MIGSVLDSALIIDPIGLHARPVVKMVKLAKSFAAFIEFSTSTDDGWVNAKSTNLVMKLRVKSGASLFVRANGSDANQAVCEIVKLIKSNFKER